MSGRNGRALSVRKTEAIVSYQHRKKASILSRHTRDRGCFVSAVVLRHRSSRHLPDRGRHRKVRSRRTDSPAARRHSDILDVIRSTFRQGQ